MATWFSALTGSRKKLGGMLRRLFAGGSTLKSEDRDDLEAALLQADIPVRLVQTLLDDIDHADPTRALQAVRRELIEALPAQETLAWETAANPRPFCILVTGINGSGKTTTCAKLAAQVQQAGLQPLLGAGDTFRAAGSSQLKIWADRIGCECVVGAQGADAAAVAFDTLAAALARKSDVVILDTAGRMHTKSPLMEELKKVRRAMDKRVPGAPHESWIVLDASMGQNALNQARMFHQSSPLTGVVVTKLDGSSKAGFIFAIQKELGVPVRFIGLGEAIEDLAPFDRTAFVDALLGYEEDATE
ncbi:MAG: signal recognition particle-docking protein FtsY [Kiritimatiellae bacterium]|nr:signal recognition particle-docking protein FtsY [Kiritimatiellia bacterium]